MSPGGAGRPGREPGRRARLSRGDEALPGERPDRSARARLGEQALPLQGVSRCAGRAAAPRGGAADAARARGDRARRRGPRRGSGRPRPRWPSSSSSRPGSRSGRSTRAARRCTSAPRRRRAPSIRPRSTSSRAPSPASSRASITSVPGTSPCAGFARAITGRPSRRRRAAATSSRTRRPPRSYRHPLAEHLEVPGARVPALLLGRGDAAGESPRDRGGPRRVGPGAPRVRRSAGERPPRHRRGPGGRARPGAARPRRRPRPRIAPRSRLSLPSVPLSPREVEYPLVHEAYAASALSDGGAARAWLAGAGDPAAVAAASPPRAVATSRGDHPPPRIHPRVRTGPDPGEELVAILEAALRPLPLDLGGREALVETYLLVHAANGLTAGAYVWNRAARGLRLLKAGEFRPGRRHLSASSSRSGPTPARSRSSCPTSRRCWRVGGAAAIGR